MTRTYRWARRAVWGTLAVIFTVGCNPLATIAFLTHKDVKVPAPHPLEFKEGPKKDKDEIVVAVFVSQGSGQSFEFAGTESHLASEIAKKWPEMAKENKQKLTILPTAKVNEFKYKNPNWKRMHATAWGKNLGADFVLDIHLDKVGIYQPGSLNQLYEGRAEVNVDVYDVEAGGEPKANYIHVFEYPKTGVKDATSIPVSKFRKEFIENLAVELCRYHIDYKASSGIADGR
jgi:hypothetical protein